MTPTHKRRDRTAECLQWSGENTVAVMGFLARHNMIGELYRGIHIIVYFEGAIHMTIDIGAWVIEGEDGAIRFYDDATFRMMYECLMR